MEALMTLPIALPRLALVMVARHVRKMRQIYAGGRERLKDLAEGLSRLRRALRLVNTRL